MRPRRNPGPEDPRGPFPRPNLTMRELMGLVLAFAVSNAFLSWIRPLQGPDALLFGIWNGLLALYLGFAFLQAWVRSVIRWRRTGDAEPSLPRRWTALGVAEATVIGGTMLCCAQLLVSLVGAPGPGQVDWAAPLAILVIGSAAGVMIVRRWRKDAAKSLTGRGSEPTIEVEPGIGHGETW